MGIENKIAVGVAALSGALAMGTDAQAQINTLTIPTQALNVTSGNISGSNPTFFEVTGMHGFSVGVFTSTSATKTYIRGNGVSFYTGGVIQVQSLSTGTLINTSFASLASTWTSSTTTLTSATSMFNPQFGTENLVFRFGSASNYQFGWINLTITGSTVGNVTPVVNSGAYTSVASGGGSITVGEVAPVPEPASAALLAMGAMTLGARGVRRMKRAKAA